MKEREPTTHDGRRFFQYADQITIAKATGIRRTSMTRITASDCVRNRTGQVVGIRVVEKGDKERAAPVLNAYKEQVTVIVDKARGASEPLFTTYDSHVDNHRFRAAYCVALLCQLEQAPGKLWFGGDLNVQNYIHLSGQDKHAGDSYHGHPTQVVAAVSGAMGHNRLEIIFSHYNYTD